MQVAGSSGRRGATLLARLLPQLSQGISTSLPAAQAAASAAAVKEPLLREFQVYRWDPDTGAKPHYDSYKIDINA